MRIVTVDKKNKSILDNIPIKEQGFPLNDGQRLEIIGHCPDCNAPIYGPRSVAASETPTVKRTCTCACGNEMQPDPKSFGDTICTK
jgi:hypothetical protein